MAFSNLRISIAPRASGLPTAQAVLLRHLLFPAYCRLTSWHRASVVFQAEGKKLLRLAKTLPEELLDKKVTIGPLMGIEESSCCWSAGMVLEHLIEVGSCFAACAVDLSRGEKPHITADLIVTMPVGEKGLRICEDYEAFLEDYEKTLAEDIGDVRSRTTCPHPWLGDLTAHRWHCLAAMHQAAHRRQMARIARALGFAQPALDG